MTDEDALLEAVELLFLISGIAGGYVSQAQRQRIAALSNHTKPARIERHRARGWMG
jgi:hypothetical protein